jgi:amino acid adenylation domain-containing protein
LRLAGDLDHALLERSLILLVERHEALRTTFALQDGVPVQCIASEPRLELRLEDVSGEPQPEESARRLCAADAARAFDLHQGPLARWLLVRLGDGDHVLSGTLHHIVTDGWSMGVIERELGAIYRALSRGQPPSLAPLAYQYADYAIWQRAKLAAGALERHIDYWKAELAGAPQALELPTDRPRPTVKGDRGTSVGIALDEELTARLRALCREQGVTLFMALLAASAAYLSRASRQDDIVVGSPIAGRRLAETEGMVGFFVNTLALRVKVAATQSFSELLRQVKETCLGAYAHQELPFEQLGLAPARDLSRAPLFQVMFALQNVPQHERDFGDLQVSGFDSGHEREPFDLSLVFWHAHERLHGILRYATELFDAGTAERMVRQLQALLEAVVAEPDRSLCAVRYDRAEALAELTARWGRRARAIGEPAAASLMARFAARAEERPDACALMAADGSLSYAELHRRSSAWAARLVELGAGRDVLIGLCIERRLDLVVALFAILKAGGAYVPLDPALPAARLELVLERAKPRVIVTQRAFASLLSCHEGELVFVDDAPPAPAGQTSLDDGHPDGLAYVLYTSGSTGVPKGVAVTRAALVDLFEAMRASVPDMGGAPVRMAWNAPLAFDTSVERWLQLLAGHTLVLLSDEERLDAGRLLACCERERVNNLDVTPTHARALLAAGLGQGSYPATLIVGGEAVDVETWRALSDLASCRSFNTYGPTECTVEASAAPIDRALEQPTIGWPLRQANLYVLDERLSPTPLGLWGELYIAGLGVARGYFAEPALTAERFLPDPHSARPGARMVRSGDIARQLPDGRFEFGGRVDRQVKLRGHRIELEEIEIALRSQPAVRDAVVALCGGTANARLVAYVVAAEGLTPVWSELRSALRERLPAVMVPAAMVLLDELPLLPSGKLDRTALPQHQPSPSSESVAPQTPLERRLVAIWSDVLRVPIGMTDDFFDAGGHSLLAIRLLWRVAEEWHVKLPLVSIFSAPNAQDMAALIQERIAGDVR